MIYVDNGILCGRDKEEISQLIRELKQEFNITDKGEGRHQRVPGSPD
jgi:hypothetical protein